MGSPYALLALNALNAVRKLRLLHAHFLRPGAVEGVQVVAVGLYRQVRGVETGEPHVFLIEVADEGRSRKDVFAAVGLEDERHVQALLQVGQADGCLLHVAVGREAVGMSGVLEFGVEVAVGIDSCQCGFIEETAACCWIGQRIGAIVAPAVGLLVCKGCTVFYPVAVVFKVQAAVGSHAEYHGRMAGMQRYDRVIAFLSEDMGSGQQ